MNVLSQIINIAYPYILETCNPLQTFFDILLLITNESLSYSNKESFEIEETPLHEHNNNINIISTFSPRLILTFGWVVIGREVNGLRRKRGRKRPRGSGQVGTGGPGRRRKGAGGSGPHLRGCRGSACRTAPARQDGPRWHRGSI